MIVVKLIIVSVQLLLVFYRDQLNPFSFVEVRRQGPLDSTRELEEKDDEPLLIEDIDEPPKFPSEPEKASESLFSTSSPATSIRYLLHTSI